MTGCHNFDLRCKHFLQMLQIFEQILRSHVGDCDLKDRSFYIPHIVNDFCGVMHYINNMIHKFRIIVFNVAGVLAGYDDLKSRTLLDLIQDPAGKTVRNDPQGDHFSLMNAQGTIFCYI